MVRKFLWLAPALLLSLAAPANAQNDHPLAQAFSNALSRSDLNGLTALLDDEVELLHPGGNGTYKKQIATGKLADFLKQNPPARFMVKHQGASADGQVYAIGQLTTQSGGNYKVLLRARPNNVKQASAVAQPGAAQPGVAQPGAAQPGVAQYKIFKLDILQNL